MIRQTLNFLNSFTALEIIFKSLYTGKLDYLNNEEDLISLMATGRMFNLDEVADIVSREMYANVEMKNVIEFYYSFESYGYQVLSNNLLKWILLNFSFWYEMDHDNFCSQILNRVEQTLLETLVTHEDFVSKNELTTYKIVKRWTVDKMKMKDGYDYFKTWNRPEPFLETDEGKEFERIFSLLLVSHLLMDADSLETLTKDNFYPESYLHRAGAENFLDLAKLSGIRGSATKANVSVQSYRLGIFHSKTTAAFQGISFNYFGIYLNFGWSGNMLTVQRNKMSKETVFNHSPIVIRIRIVFYSPGKFSELISKQDSGFKEHEILENELLNLMEWKSDDNNTCTRVTTAQIPALIHNQSVYGYPLYQHHSFGRPSLGPSASSPAATGPKFPRIVSIELSFQQPKTADIDDVHMTD